MACRQHDSPSVSQDALHVFTSTSARGTLAAAARFVVVLLDVSVVNVALDALRQEFATDVAGLQWVINAYTLVSPRCCSPAARSGTAGARRIFLAGFLVFTVASAACGLSGSRMLIAARLVQGWGRHCWCRTRWPCCSRPFPIASSAAARWAGGAHLAACRAAGPVLGGMLVTHMGWRSIFSSICPLA